MNRRLVGLLLTLMLVSTPVYILQSQYKARFIDNPAILDVTPRTRINDTKIILDWTGIWSYNFTVYWPGFLNMCPQFKNKCTVTADKKLYARADAIVFHIREFIFRYGLVEMPKNRFAFQRYIAYTTESPAHTYYDLRKSDHFFNWTFTYRHDSDIFWPYGEVVPKDEGAQLPNYGDERELFKNKSKMASWWVSDCHVDSRRMDYVRELQKHISVDIFGACGPFKCAWPEQDCDGMLAREYKFYLAFENSVCNDYITEKFYFRIRHAVIPVVLRDSEYKKFDPNGHPTAPEKSYIAADHFPSPKALADYLKFLASNEDEYLRYFEWKQKWTINEYYGKNQGLCQLCHMLNSNLPPKSYSGQELSDWWYGPVYKRVCVSNYALTLMGKNRTN